VAETFAPLDVLAEFITALPRHKDIRQHNIRRTLFQHFESLLAVSHRDDFQTLIRESQFHHLLNCDGIVREQQPALASRDQNRLLQFEVSAVSLRAGGLPFEHKTAQGM
jgi:hypothetical protein